MGTPRRWAAGGASPRRACQHPGTHPSPAGHPLVPTSSPPSNPAFAGMSPLSRLQGLGHLAATAHRQGCGQG